jgi:predicted DNA-binding protein with PD1-like motif
MNYTQASLGRVFIVKLENNEIVHETIEQIAEKEKILAGIVFIVGGIGEDSTLVVGPIDGDVRPITVMERTLKAPHEVAGVGTLFSTENGKPVLHMHLSAGRKGDSLTGCIRRGVRVWGVLEATVIEFTDTTALKRYEKDMDNYMLQI